MAEATKERVRQHIGEDDPGLVTEAKVIAAVQRIVELAKPLRVVAFGSRARGDHRRDSDLDLAVIVEKYDPKASTNGWTWMFLCMTLNGSGSWANRLSLYSMKS